MNTTPAAPSGLLTDNDALTVYRAIPGEADEGKRTALVGLLSDYTAGKRAQGLEPFQPSPEAHRAQTTRFEQLYASIDGVESKLAPEQATQLNGLLATSANPVEAKARMVNMAYLQDQHGATLPAGWDSDNWPAMRKAYAKNVLGIDKPEISDTELFGAIGKHVEKKAAERVMLTNVVAKVQMAAFEGTGNWLEAYEKAAKGIDADAGYDPKARDTYRGVAKRAFEQVKETADRLRPIANNIVGSLAREQGARKGFEDSRGFSTAEMVAMVESVPDKERPLLYSIVAQMSEVSPETVDAKNKGVVQQTGEAVGRGFVDVLRANKRALADNPSMIQARALAEGADRLTVTGERRRGESLVDYATRSMRGNYGAVDFVKDVVTQNGQPFLKDRRPLTDDEKVSLKSEVEVMQRDAAIRSELRQIAEGVVDPIKGSNFFTEKVYYPALENAAYSAQAFVPYAGLPLLINSTVGMRSEEMMQRGMSIEDAQAGALVSGVLEAPVEMMQMKMVTGAFPIFKGLLEAPVNGLKAVATRAAGVLGVQLLEQNAQEAVQDAMPLLVQHVASKLKDTVPGLDWDKELTAYGKGRVDTFWALMPMVLVGTGSATFSDASYGRQYLNDLTTLKAAGFTEEAAAKIIEAPTLEEKQAIVRSSWNDERLRKMNGEAQMAALEDMDADMREAYVEATGDGARISRLEDGSFEVTTPDGELVDIATDADAALDLARDWNRADNLNMETAIQDMVAYVESFQESGQSIEVVQGSRTLQDRVDAGDYTADEAEAIVDTYVALGRLERGSTAADALITGENEVTRYDGRRRIVSDVSRIYEGANPLTVVEEHAEGYLKRRLADGGVTLEDVARWRDAVDGAGAADNSERALKEWFSEQAQAYLVGKSDAKAVPASLRGFLSKLKQYFTRVMDLAVRLMEKERAGELPDGFKTHLARAVGLDEAFIDSQRRADEVSQLGGRGEELMGWLKGRLPHPETARANGEQLAGELQTVWEGFKSPQAARAFFSPKGEYTPLDQLAGMAKDDGFAFETADDLLQAIDSSLRGVEVFAESGAETFSMGRAVPADASNVVELPDGARLVGPTTFSITAYHGTPHKVGAFKTKNIGTGEGVQAYGWGLYFAENPLVAEAYKDKLGPGRGADRVDVAQRIMNAVGGDVEKALAEVAKRRKTANIPGSDERFDEVEAIIRDGAGLANIYTVEILPDADKFLDWDGSLAAQPDAVRAALEAFMEKDGWGAFLKAVKAFDAGDTKAMRAAGYSLFDYVGTVGSIYQTMGSDMGEKALSVALAKAGVPGFRYLDGGSRNVGEGTRNFVLFDDSLVKIVAENGKPVGDRTFSVTDSKEFKAWFGNSKVVDADGKPLVVYHGTAEAFSEFTQSFAKNTGTGYYFTDDTDVAKTYAGQTVAEKAAVRKVEPLWEAYLAKIDEVAERTKTQPPQNPESTRSFIRFLNNENLTQADRKELNDLQDAWYEANEALYNTEMERAGTPSVMELFLSIKNPLEIDAGGFGWDLTMKDIVEQAKAGGRDGVIVRNVRDAAADVGRSATTFIAFKSDQIKSAIGNRGTFDPANPDITMAMESRRRVDEIHDEMKMRRVAARVVAGEHAGESFAPAIRKAMEGLMYQVVPNKVTVSEALKIVDERGVGEATNIVMSNTADYPASVQVALGLALMEHFNGAKNYEKASMVGERVAELGTELGRGVQVFSLLGRVLDTPEKAQIFLSRQVKKLEKAMRDRTPAIDAAKDVVADVQAEALKLLEGWLDQINGVAGRPAASKKAIRLEDLPDITFSLSQDMRKSGIVSVVSRMLKESGAVETRKALVERYGEKITPFIPDILIESQKLLMKRVAPPKTAKAGTKKAKPGESADTGKGKSGERLPDDQVDAALDEIRKAARKSDVQLDVTAIDEHFTGKRMTPEQVDAALAMGRAFGLSGEQTQLDGLADLAQRLEDEVIARMKVKGFETPVAVRNAVRTLFETKGVKFTAADVARVFAEKFKVPKATEVQNTRLAQLAENVRSTPDRSTERTDATVELMNHVNDILKPVDVIDKAWAVWYANVLSGYNTHFRNMYANVLEQMLALPLDATRANPVATLQLMREMLFGVKAGVSIGISEAKQQVKTGNASVLQTDSNKFGTAGTLERVKFAGGNANPFNWLKVVGRALRAEDLFAYATASEAKARMVAWEMATAKGKTGEAREAEIESLLNATEEQIGDFKERAGREWDGLTDELRAGKDRAAWVNRRVSELRILERDSALIERASEFAARATFNFKPDGFVGIMANGLTDALGRLSQVEATGRLETVQKALMTAPKLVVPFVRIVANVLNRGIDYSGAGVVRAVASTKRVGSLGGQTSFQAKTADERAMELKRGIFGIVTLGVLSALADPDDDEAPIQIHGAGAGSRDRNIALHGPRWMPYSIEIRTDTGSKFVTYQYSPLLMGLALVGNWHDARRYKKLDEKETTERLAIAATGIGSVLLDQSFLSNAADLVSMFGRDGQTSERALYSFLGRTFNPATVALPFSSLLRQMERDFDPVARDKADILGSLMSNVAVASRFNEPALDVLGDAIPNRPLDWWARSSADGTPEARIYRAFAAKGAVPTGIWTYKGTMEPEQFYQFTKERGAIIKETLMRNDAQLLKAIESGNDEVAATIVENVSRTATQIARARVGFVPSKTNK